MALPMDKPVPESACNPACVPRGLKWLLAAHLVLSLTPVVPLLEVGRTDNWLRFARDLTLGIPVAQVLLLILWVGMGTSRLRTRLLGGLLGNALRGLMAILSFLLARASGCFSLVDWDYLRWAGLWQLMESLSYPTESSDYPESCLWGSLWILFLAGLCRLVWGRFAEIRYLPSREKTLSHASFRSSIRHLLAATAVVAFLLGLACRVRPPSPCPRFVDYSTILRISVSLASVYAM